MLHVFGYTIPDFSHTPGISETIKLDLLVMANLTNEYLHKGEDCLFFLCVMNNNVMENFNSAMAKYEHKGTVKIQYINPDVTDFKKYLHIIDAKVYDLGSRFEMPSPDTPEKRRKIEKFARLAGGRCLRRTIKRFYPGLEHIKEKYLHPPGLEWSYYGQLKQS